VSSHQVGLPPVDGTLPELCEIPHSLPRGIEILQVPSGDDRPMPPKSPVTVLQKNLTSPKILKTPHLLSDFHSKASV
jgi:hypothetical protein